MSGDLGTRKGRWRTRRWPGVVWPPGMSSIVQGASALWAVLNQEPGAENLPPERPAQATIRGQITRSLNRTDDMPAAHWIAALYWEVIRYTIPIGWKVKTEIRAPED